MTTECMTDERGCELLSEYDEIHEEALRLLAGPRTPAVTARLAVIESRKDEIVRLTD